MGPKSDRMSVVDSTLRVYGVKGLRVVDASIMPQITTGNTNVPTIMIAEKASDLVKYDYLPLLMQGPNTLSQCPYLNTNYAPK